VFKRIPTVPIIKSAKIKSAMLLLFRSRVTKGAWHLKIGDRMIKTEEEEEEKEKEKAKKSVLSIKDLFSLGGLDTPEMFEKLKEISSKFGEDFVFDLFDKDNNYSLHYFYLAQAGIGMVKPTLLKMINDPSFCEKDNEQDPYYGSLGLLFLNDPSGIDYFRKFLRREIKELYYQSNDEFVDDLILKKTDATKSMAKVILEDYSETINEKSMTKLKVFLES
jgi:hypothetical protein